MEELIGMYKFSSMHEVTTMGKWILRRACQSFEHLFWKFVNFVTYSLERESAMLKQQFADCLRLNYNALAVAIRMWTAIKFESSKSETLLVGHLDT